MRKKFKSKDTDKEPREPNDIKPPKAPKPPKDPNDDTRYHKPLLAAIIVGTIAVAGTAGFLSYETLTEYAKPALKEEAFLFPVVVDAAVLLFASITLYKSFKGYRNLGTRMAMHLMSGMTIAFNMSAGEDFEYQMIHAAAPIVWVMGIEIVLGMVRKEQKKKRPQLDKIRFVRFVLSPISSFSMWRRMVLWEITDASIARRIDAVRIRQRLVWQKAGFFWRFYVTNAERTELRIRLLDMAEAVNSGVPLSSLTVPLGDTGHEGRPADVPQISAVPHTSPVAVSPVVPQRDKEGTRDIPESSRPANEKGDVSPDRPARPVPYVPDFEGMSREGQPEGDTRHATVPVKRDTEGTRNVPQGHDSDTVRDASRTLTRIARDDINEELMRDLRAFLSGDPESKYASQAALAKAHGKSTSQVSRVATKVKKELELVNGS